MNASGIGLGAGLLQVTDGMNCPTDEATYDDVLQPIEVCKQGPIQYRNQL